MEKSKHLKSENQSFVKQQVRRNTKFRGGAPDAGKLKAYIQLMLMLTKQADAALDNHGRTAARLDSQQWQAHPVHRNMRRINENGVFTETALMSQQILGQKTAVIETMAVRRSLQQGQARVAWPSSWRLMGKGHILYV